MYPICKLHYTINVGHGMHINVTYLQKNILITTINRHYYNSLKSIFLFSYYNLKPMLSIIYRHNWPTGGERIVVIIT